MRGKARPIVLVALLSTFLGGFAMGIAIGGFFSRDRERSAAIRAGAARYVADPQTGAIRFTYIRR